MNSFRLWMFRSLILSFIFFFEFSHLEAASFVLGKQYQLKQKRKKGSLVWHSVAFDKSVTGEFKISLVVYSAQGKTIEFFDDYTNFVSQNIDKYCVSKFAMTNYKVNFDKQKKATISFQTPSLSQVMYLPLKVKYKDGFEDYLTRLRIVRGKFAISSRPLQQGKVQKADPKALKKLKAQHKQKKEEKRKKKEQLAQEEEKKRKAEEERKDALEKEGIKVDEDLLKSSEDSIENPSPLKPSLETTTQELKPEDTHLDPQTSQEEVLENEEEISGEKLLEDKKIEKETPLEEDFGDKTFDLDEEFQDEEDTESLDEDTLEDYSGLDEALEAVGELEESEEKDSKKDSK